VLGEFQCYIKPSTGAGWSEEAIQTHGMGSRNHPNLSDAVGIVDGMNKLCEFKEQFLPAGKVGCDVAWNGKACEMTQ
jgi:hypothetical protein